jgi:hypothetical protein
MTEDEACYGEPYWHRVHQVPGVCICPTHNEVLLQSDVAISCKQNKHAFILLDQYETKRKEAVKDKQFNSSHYLNIATNVHWLLNNEISAMGLEKIRNRYVGLLMNRGFASTMGKVRQRDLIRSFRQFYGEQFLEHFNCAVHEDVQDNWLMKLVRKLKGAAHPIRHILFMFFMDQTPKQFFEDNRSYHPFGNGPWICLNAASSHYRQHTIKKCLLTRNSNTGGIMGTFFCSCGFVYIRRGPDLEGLNQEKVSKILEFGDAWKTKLLQLAEKKKSLRQIAIILNVDHKTVNKYLKILRMGQEKKEKNESCFNHNLSSYRSKWLKTVRDNDRKSKTEIRRVASKEYAWLYRHDREWLDKNSPAPMSRMKRENNRVDWSQRDINLFGQVTKAAKELRGYSIPTRITINSIGRKIGQLHYLQKKLNKLPKTKELLETVVDSLEDFQIRWIKFVAEGFRVKGEEVLRWKIIREAGLWRGFSERVEKKIQQEMD